MVVEFLAWAMYWPIRACSTTARATRGVLASVRARYGSELFPPRAANGRVAVRAMRLTLDRVRLNHRPLALYRLAARSEAAAALVMRGFSYHANGPVAFGSARRRAARGRVAADLHGVSASRLPYLPLFFSCLGERAGARRPSSRLRRS